MDNNQLLAEILTLRGINGDTLHMKFQKEVLKLIRSLSDHQDKFYSFYYNEIIKCILDIEKQKNEK